MNLDLNLLVVFQAIYRERQLTQAATTIGLTQSAVSQALGRLRVHFRDELFVRIPGGMEPTARAHSIAVHIAAALQAAEQALQVVKGFDPKVSDECFLIGLLDIDVVFLGPKLINHFQTHAPNIQFNIISIERDSYVERLDRGDIHLAINLIENKLPKRFSTARLFSDELVVISKSNHPRIKNRLTLKEFLKLSHVKVDWMPHEKEAIEPLFVQNGVTRKVPITLKQVLGVPFVVKQTDLIATVPLTLMDYYKDLKGLAVYNFPGNVSPVHLSLIWHQRIQGNQAYEWMIREIQEVCGKINMDRKQILT